MHNAGRAAVDGAGDLFIADGFNNVIREVTPAVTVTIGPSTALPLTAISASAAAVVPGQPVTFTATVTDLSSGGAIPNGGTVTFTDQTGTIGSETLVDGGAEFTTSSLAAGSHTRSRPPMAARGLRSSASGTIVTAAGNGTVGYEGDNGPAIAAELDAPRFMVFDSAGDMFIADTANNVVREVVKSTGDIITFAGNGIAGYKRR